MDKKNEQIINKEAKIFYKVHELDFRVILAICDSELIGKKFSSNNIYLDLETYKNFYFGDLLDLKDASELFENADSINIVGKNSVQLALNLGYAKESDIMFIENTPHLQIYKLKEKG
jgi:hypothetical protein